MPAAKWQSSLMPYVKNENSFRCPEAVKEFGANSFGYAFNMNLDMTPFSSQDKPERVICFFETNSLGENIAGGSAIMARPGRHNRRGGFAYLDGHGTMVRDGDDPGSWTLNPTR